MTLEDYTVEVLKALEHTEMPTVCEFLVHDNLMSPLEITSTIHRQCRIAFEAPIPIVPVNEMAKLVCEAFTKLYHGYINHAKTCPNCKKHSSSVN